MSYFRLILIPVFAFTYLTAHTRAQYIMAILFLALSALTDVFDGPVARAYQMVTELGKFLDPLADKLTLGVVFLCMTSRFALLWLLVAIYIVKEGFMGIMGLITLKRRKIKLDGAMWFGKMCTAASFIVMLILLLFPGIPKAAANGLICLCGAIMVFTLIMYILKFRDMWIKTRPSA